MPFGVIHYRAPGDTLEAFLDYAADTGFDVVELQAVDAWPEGNESPERRAEEVRRMLDARGVAASALATSNDFVVLDEAVIDHQLHRMARLSKLAVIIGAKILRTEGGRRKPEVPKERESEAIAECLKRCLEFAEKDDTYLAVDNHGQVTNEPEILLSALRSVGSPRAGSNLDTANIRWADHDLDTCRDFYDAVAPLVLHTHIKDCIGTCVDGSYVGTIHGQGEVDLPHALRALKQVGYDGAYTAEWEGPGDDDSGVAYAECLAWMRQNIT